MDPLYIYDKNQLILSKLSIIWREVLPYPVVMEATTIKDKKGRYIGDVVERHGFNQAWILNL